MKLHFTFYKDPNILNVTTRMIILQLNQLIHEGCHGVTFMTNNGYKSCQMKSTVFFKA